MKDVIVELGLSLVLLSTDMALSYPLNDLSDVFTFGILAFFVVPVQLPRQVEPLLAF